MGLVTTWLRGIGLSHCSAAFRAAGITTPSALSKLTLADYDRLGVVDVNERKKLFYLVQRIKMAVRESEGTNPDANNDENNEQSDNVRVGDLPNDLPPQQPDLKMTKSASYSSAASQLSINTNRTPSPVDTTVNNESPKLKEAKLMRNLSFEREEIKKRSATPMTESSLEDEAPPIQMPTKIQLPQKKHSLLPPSPPSRDSPRQDYSFEAPSSDEDVAPQKHSRQTRKKQPARASKIPAPSKRSAQPPNMRPPSSPYLSSEDEEDQEFLRRQAEEEKKKLRKERLLEQKRRQQEQAKEEERIRREEKIAEELERRKQAEEEEKIRRKQRQVEQMKRKQQQAKEEARLRRLQEEEEEEEEEMRRLVEEEEMLRQQQKQQAQAARKSRQSLSTPPRHSKPSRSRSTPPTPPEQTSNGANAVPQNQRRNSSSPNKRPTSSPSHPPLHKMRSRSPSPSPNVPQEQPQEQVTYQGNQDAQTWQDFVDYSRRCVSFIIAQLSSQQLTHSTAS
ncbi:hypothetical protein TrLO_g14456 [Triparma laevis f. longispina]|uniref:SAM domain-containing protein n=1 Tax=Triparma laevis f. longispina TaxID=1714387 RepID=A0A9W7EBF1_9STRA|nr:hypothetical protein TrLO_g14456 [Triparma laevis f. longispina]